MLQDDMNYAKKENQQKQFRKEILIPTINQKQKKIDNPKQNPFMQFSLLTKKGNKQNIKQINVPLDTTLARQT